MKRRRILLVMAAMALIFAAWFFFVRSREPEYEGKSLSYWFKEYCRSDENVKFQNAEKHARASKAMRSLGTNAVPYLVKQALNTNQDSRLRKILIALSAASPRSWKVPVMLDADMLRDEAVSALREIKPPANLLLPFLKPAFASTNDLQRRAAVYAAGSAGPGAETIVPYLTAALNDSNRTARYLAIQSISWIGPEAHSAVPALMEAMKPPNGSVSYAAPAAAQALGSVGSNAAPAIPLLQTLFEKETNWSARGTYAAAIFRIDAGRSEALKFLIDGLKDRQPPVDRWRAARLLGDMGPAARAAEPALLEVLATTTNVELWAMIPDALVKIGMTREVFLPVMKKAMTSDDETMRINAAARVLYFVPTNRDARTLLIDTIKKESGFSMFAIERLGDAGPAAKDALPVLREQLKSREEILRNVTAEAIKKIEAKEPPR